MTVNELAIKLDRMIIDDKGHWNVAVQAPDDEDAYCADEIVEDEDWEEVTIK